MESRLSLILSPLKRRGLVRCRGFVYSKLLTEIRVDSAQRNPENPFLQKLLLEVWDSVHYSLEIFLVVSLGLGVRFMELCKKGLWS